MIRCDKGNVSYKGMSKDLIIELICIMKCFLEKGVANTSDMIAIMQVVLEGNGVEIVRVTEDELKDIFQEIAEEDEPPKKPQKHVSNDDVDDIFKKIWRDDYE